MNKRSVTRRSVLKTITALGVVASGWLNPLLSFARESKPDLLQPFKGILVWRSDPAWLRWFWGMTWYSIKPRRFPAVIAQPQDAGDIQLLLAYAAQAGHQVALRSSGHNITHSPLRHNAVTIDLSLFNSIDIDAGSKTAWAGPGVFSQQLNEETFQHGLVFPGAHTGFVTLGGFLLGGGMGWNMPAYGMGCASVLAAELMLADGRIVTASATENPDLFWAIRGVGPGFFAVVLRYKLQLHPAPAAVMNTFYFPLDRLGSAIEEVLTLLPANNQRSEILGALGRFSPPGTPAAEQRWHYVLNVISFGATEEAATAVAEIFNRSRLPEICTLHSVHNRSLNYLDLFSALGATDAYSTSRTSETAFFTEHPEKVLPVIAGLLEQEAVDSRSFGFSVIDTNPTVPEPCSFTHWAPHYVSWYLIGENQQDFAANERLMKKLNAAIAPWASGYYINEIDLSIAPEMARQCFSDEKWLRLNELREKWDPEKLFFSYVTSDPDH